MSDNSELLQQAIDRNSPVALVLPSTSMMKSYRSRLLAIGDAGIILESVPGEADAIDALIRSEQPVIVAFRADTQKVEFRARILKRERGYRLNADTELEVLHLPRPETVKAVQRRNDYRVTVPAESELSFGFFRVSEQDDFSAPPVATTSIVLDVRDFSAGGVGGIWKRRKDDPPTLASAQRIRVEIASPQGKATVDARVRFLDGLPDPSMQRIGLQFVLNPQNLQDRQKMTLLNKILGELQRLELRRKKLAR